MSQIGALFGPLWGIVGVATGAILMNRGNDRRLTQQLSDARQQNERERHLSLKRDIYLEAIEALSAGMSGLTRLMNLSRPPGDSFDDFHAKSNALGKVDIVASEATVRAVRDVTLEIGNALSDLIGRRLLIDSMKQRLDALSAKVGDECGEGKEKPEATGPSTVSKSRTDRRSEKGQQPTFEVADKLLDCHKTFIKAYGDFAKHGHEVNARIKRSLVPAVVAIRSELNLPINETEYQNIVEEGISNGEVVIEKYFKGMETTIDLLVNLEKDLHTSGGKETERGEV